MVLGFQTPHTVARLVLDTSDVIEWGNTPLEYQGLETLYKQFRVFLAKTDVVDTELDPEKNEMVGGRFLASIKFLELHGPVVLDNSRLNHTVLASDEDVRRLDQVKEIVGISTVSERKAKHDLRDAMHIATSIRYGYDGFITRDKRLEKRNDQFLHEFGFRIMNVDEAVTHVKNLIEHVAHRDELNRKLSIQGATREGPDS
jgi:predicted nucleic acid-binding protein